MLALLLLACARPCDSGVPVDTAEAGPCPRGMVLVGAFCIDAYEATVTGELGDVDQEATWPLSTTEAVASSEAGVLPTTLISWYQASAACQNAGKHLCTVEEWQSACGDGAFPWGEEPPAEEVCALPGPDGSTDWDGVQPTGSLPDCRSPGGVYDQMGNAWEWADPGTFDPTGRPMTAKMGGAWYSGWGNAGCALTWIGEHPPSFNGTIAARCCVEAGGADPG